MTVLLLSIEMARTLDPKRNWPAWSSYATASGGFLDTASEFWGNEMASLRFESRLKYLQARFSGHPSLFAWELFNEVEYMNNVYLLTLW